MVTKTKKGSQKKGKVNVGKLKLNKETIKGLTGSEQKQIKGGLVGPGSNQPGCSIGIVHLPQLALLPQRTG